MSAFCNRCARKQAAEMSTELDKARVKLFLRPGSTVSTLATRAIKLYTHQMFRKNTTRLSGKPVGFP